MLRMTMSRMSHFLDDLLSLTFGFYGEKNIQHQTIVWHGTKCANDTVKRRTAGNQLEIQASHLEGP